MIFISVLLIISTSCLISISLILYKCLYLPYLVLVSEKNLAQAKIDWEKSYTLHIEKAKDFNKNNKPI